MLKTSVIFRRGKKINCWLQLNLVPVGYKWSACWCWAFKKLSCVWRVTVFRL